MVNITINYHKKPKIPLYYAINKGILHKRIKVTLPK